MSLMTLLKQIIKNIKHNFNLKKKMNMIPEYY